MKTIHIGDPTIAWDRLGPQADTKRVVLTQAGIDRAAGTTTETIDTIEVDGRPALRRTQTLESDLLGQREATTVVARATFEPISHHDAHAGQALSIRYDGMTVAGTLQRQDGRVEPIHLTLPRPVFDSHSVEMVLRVLPLTTGYSARLPAFHTNTMRVIWITLRVQGAETVNAGGEEEDAWILQVDFGHAQQTYWIGQMSRELLKQSSVLEAGTTLTFIR